MKTKALLLLYFVAIFTTVKATTITVTNTRDTGIGSLREAVKSASAGDIIRFDRSLISSGSATIRLKTAITINKGLFLVGLYNSKDTLFISGRDTNQIFNISMPFSMSFYNVEIDSMVFIRGNGTYGGAIQVNNKYDNSNGRLTVKNCIFRNCKATNGGAIGCYRANNNSSEDIRFFLTVNKCNFIANNCATDGGAIYAYMYANGSGTSREAKIEIKIIASNFLNNLANNSGGALYANGYGWSGSTVVGKVSIDIISSSFAKNEAKKDGGAIYCYAQSYSTSSSAAAKVEVNCTTSTFNANKAIGNGGSIYAFSTSEVISLSHFNTFFKNTCLLDGSAFFLKSTATNNVSTSRVYLFLNHTILLSNAGNNSYNNTTYLNGGWSRQTESIGFNIVDVPKTHFSNYVNYTSTGGANDYFSKTETDVKLGSLTKNKRNTYSNLPDSGSLAINNGAPLSIDSAQNGPILGIRDIGASESKFCSPTVKTTNVVICEGNTYAFAGKSYNKTGIYRDTIVRKGKCDSINELKLTVNPKLLPNISITANTGNTVMSGINITFSATVSNGGSNPIYQWYINSVPVGSNANSFVTSSLNNHDIVSCRLTSNYACLIRNLDSSNELKFTVHANNNEPCNAIELPVNKACTAQIYSNFGATKTSGVANPTCASTATNDVWFKIKSPLGGKVFMATYSGGLTDAVLTLYSGTCNSMVEIGCIDDYLGNKMPEALLENAVPCDYYLLRVSRYSGNDGTFGICLTDPSNAANPVIKNINGSLCAGGSYLFAGKTLTQIGMYSDTIKRPCQPDSIVVLTLSNASPVTPDVFISSDLGNNFISGATVKFTASIANAGINPTYQWFVNNTTIGSNSNSFTTNSLTHGSAIFCILTSSESCVTKAKDTSNTITVNVSANNDEPCTAINLSVNANCTIETFTNNGASTTAVASAPSCALAASKDVWFTFTCPASKSIDVKTFPGTMTDAVITIYGGNCATPIEIDCIDDLGAKKMPEMELRNYSPGLKYYLRVSQNTGNSGTFGICLTEPQNQKNSKINSRLVSIYPNPNNGYFTVSYSNIKKIVVTDISGKTIHCATEITEKECKVKMPKNAKGFYLIQIFALDGIITQKVAVE